MNGNAPRILTVRGAFLISRCYFLPPRAWDSALPAAVFDAALVRPSRRTLLAACAAFELVCFVFFATMGSLGLVEFGAGPGSAECLRARTGDASL